MERETVDELAQLSKLDLDPAERARAQSEIDGLLAFFDILSEVDTTGVEPTFAPVDRPLRTRADVPQPVLSCEDVLHNAAQTRAGAFVVPRVVEG